MSNKSNGTKIYHLSHIDADGYGCQKIINDMKTKGAILFGDKEALIHKSYNANYDYIEDVVEKILQDIKQENNKEPKLLLITDLNLRNVELYEKIEKDLIKNHNCKIKVIDHHMTGEEMSKRFDWYNLNGEDCATKLLFDYIKKENPNIDFKEEEKYALEIDNYDLYKNHNSKKFLTGALYQDAIFSSNDFFKEKDNLNLKVQDIKREYILFMLNQIQKKLNENFSIRNISMFELDKVKKEFVSYYLKSNNKKDNTKSKVVSIPNHNLFTIDEKIKVMFILLKKVRYGNVNQENYSQEEENLLERLEGLKKISKEKVLKQYSNKIKENFPKGFEKEIEYFKGKLKEEIENLNYSQEKSEEENSLEDIEEMYQLLYLEYVKTFENKTKEKEELIKNENIPMKLLIPMLTYDVIIPKNIQSKVTSKSNTLKSDIEITFDLPSTYFQHASHNYVKNKNIILINFKLKQGTASVRASNEKGVNISKIFGGGGHPNASGFFVKIEDLYKEEEEIIKLLKSNKKPSPAMRMKIQKIVKEYLTNKIKDNFLKKSKKQDNISK
jgi:oligoribonuclease NrnB/cAMP/cGMP phosphodiesterase (DHH superfamily)